MNENLNLCEILKDFPKGTKLYSTIYGNVEFDCIESDCEYPIAIRVPKYDTYKTLTFDGRMHRDYDGECTLFPSKEQRDWSKFTAPWYKKEKFDPKTLNPFDRVLVSDVDGDIWHCNIFEYIRERDYPYSCVYSAWERCIPYNDETKHLVGTKDEAPEYYRYWEE